ncbi:hypothetical protein THAOC_29969, partial [Thalassiosira oceanica]
VPGPAHDGAQDLVVEQLEVHGARHPEAPPDGRGELGEGAPGRLAVVIVAGDLAEGPGTLAVHARLQARAVLRGCGGLPADEAYPDYQVHRHLLGSKDTRCSLLSGCNTDE